MAEMSFGEAFERAVLANQARLAALWPEIHAVRGGIRFERGVKVDPAEVVIESSKPPAMAEDEDEPWCYEREALGKPEGCEALVAATGRAERADHGRCDEGVGVRRCRLKAGHAGGHLQNYMTPEGDAAYDPATLTMDELIDRVLIAAKTTAARENVCTVLEDWRESLRRYWNGSATGEADCSKDGLSEDLAETLHVMWHAWAARNMGTLSPRWFALRADLNDRLREFARETIERTSSTTD